LIYGRYYTVCLTKFRQLDNKIPAVTTVEVSALLVVVPRSCTTFISEYIMICHPLWFCRSITECSVIYSKRVTLLKYYQYELYRLYSSSHPTDIRESKTFLGNDLKTGHPLLNFGSNHTVVFRVVTLYSGCQCLGGMYYLRLLD
jgi:hypothetical protein